jgi:tetratricopeptide (TPR) repeat protein
VLLSGAGFAGNPAPPRDALFEVFSAVGTLDFNYQEVVPLQEKLQQAGFPRWLYIFDGPHQWAPAEAMEQALAWFRLQAMKANRQARDSAFISAQLSQAVSGANSAEHSGDLLSAYREYLQIADTFDGLTDVAALRAKAELLGKEKSLHEAAKQERRDFDEQLRLSAEVLNSISAPDENTRGQLETNGSAEDKARALRVRTEEEKRASRTLVYKRALADAFVGAMESGGAYLENRDYVRAVRAFSAATEAAPNSEWAWGNLACAHGVAGNRKEALSALRRARTVAKDKTAFAAWAKTEPAFDRIRSAPEFQELLKMD